MSTKHTPGPWEFSTTADGARIRQHAEPGSGNPTIAWVGCDYINDMNLEELSPEGVANARLIAAAPELLEACAIAEEQASYALRRTRLDVEEAKKHLANIQKLLRAAIAKAEDR